MNVKSFDRLRQRLYWPVTREMNPVETLAWRADSVPGLRFNLLGMVLLDEAPDWERLVRRHEWFSLRVSRFHQRVVEPPFRWGQPFLVTDGNFRVDNHLHRVRLPAPGSIRQLLDYAQNLANGPFDPFRPLWEAYLIEGIDGGRAAYLCKIHHSVTDGVGAGQMLAMLHDTAPVQEPPDLLPPPANPSPDRPIPLFTRRLWQFLRRHVPGRTQTGTTLGGADRTTGAGRRPPTAWDLVSTLATIVRSTVRPPVSPSPLLHNRSRSTRFEVVDLPLPALRAAGSAGGGSANDAFLAGLAGGIHRYHQRSGVPLDELPAMIPISLRRPNDPPGGNLVGAARLVLPLAQHSPVERIRLIHDQVSVILRGPTFDALDMMIRLAAALPAAVVSATAALLFNGVDLVTSNFSGAPVPLYLAGAKVAGIHPFPPQVRTAICVALLTYHDRAQAGISLDTGAFSDPRLLMDCLHESLAEILALATPSTLPARPSLPDTVQP